MSGGSWDYLYSRLEDAANRLDQSGDPHRKALGRAMSRLATAMHAVEWVDSGDWGTPDDVVAIEKALGADAVPLVLSELERSINDAHAKATELIARHRKAGM
jgi:2-hydroxychromene-2-carboxylate isomerase